MIKLLMAASAFAMLGSAAFADEVVVKPLLPGVVVEHRAADEGTTTSRTVEHGNGCATHSVTHTNDATDNSVTHTNTNC